MIVEFYGRITGYTNGDKVYTPKNHSVIKTLLEELSDYYGDEFNAVLQGSETCLILVNGKGMMLSGGLETPLHAGDKIEILPFVDAG